MCDSSSMAATVLGMPEKAHIISINLLCGRSSSRDQMTLAMSWEDLCSRADLKL